jgi:hypothetical protein
VSGERQRKQKLEYQYWQINSQESRQQRRPIAAESREEALPLSEGGEGSEGRHQSYGSGQLRPIFAITGGVRWRMLDGDIFDVQK